MDEMLSNLYFDETTPVAKFSVDGGLLILSMSSVTYQTKSKELHTWQLK